ncbi:hypothetical protein AM493_09900 [Flavobacterium akiainvivens]|uniref:Uncharacterized protein n=1 Tax=Flavobacterium akiainvivens TaxID=1202724 RepID=A0A0M8MHG2_9FLAO|nr:hypothetical protein [Flavobacterium akiainvivens]KOS06311.1 hypothetical protein AM493_09900 [Flavobacterium akiainvivens]SFQ16595.1 hypothetical protein SAMN05444144_101385 [Flavobacterium akiainvivens]
MKKLINLLTALVIYFALAAIVEFTVGWGVENKWFFIGFWSVTMALADVFIFQPLRKKRQALKKQPPLK